MPALDSALGTEPQARVESPGGWAGELQLRYAWRNGRTVAHDRHEGPLRVLKALYPEGPAWCEHTLVHPPGGLAGGDKLRLEARLEPGAQVLLTTPGATRFYRSGGSLAEQSVHLELGGQARLEWLPLETLAYPGCLARNQLSFSLAEGASMIGWDILGLGLPASNAPFATGSFEQCLHWPGVWLEQGRLQADDTVLLDGATGLAGYRVCATLWAASGTAWDETSCSRLLAAARDKLPELGADCAAGASSADARLVVVRMLAQRVEPVFDTWRRIRQAWRAALWGLPPSEPRIWRL